MEGRLSTNFTLTKKVAEMYKDGRYLVRHIELQDGIKEREIIIKNGKVIMEESEFTQEDFFSINEISRAL